ncbi:cysteine proteinase, partial [Acaromyces ingoldii]
YPGLYNTGNSCFLNSTLQSLAAVGRLERYLVAVEALAEEWDVPTPVTDGLHDVVQQLNRRQKRQRAFVPTALTDALARLPRSNARSFLQAHQQQDAHELLVLVSSALDDERAAVLAERDATIRAVTVGLGAAAIAPSSLPSSSSPHGIGADAQSPFRGLVAQRTACMDCGYVEAVRHYASDELSLAVPARAGAVVRLETCLANWARLERVDWICHRCSLVATLARATADVAHKDYNRSKNKGDKARKRKLKEATQREERLRSALQANLGEDDVEGSGLLADVRMERVMSQLATKHVMLARPPPLLVIHLNRSSYAAGAFGASKNNATVVFSEWLDVAPITTAGELDVRADQPISRSGTPGPDGQPFSSSSSSSLPSPPPPQTLYRLCAIVVHYGGHSSGHYVSFRRRSPSPSSSSWSRISDADVQPCAPSDVFRQNPFLLFYERLD